MTKVYDSLIAFLEMEASVQKFDDEVWAASDCNHLFGKPLSEKNPRSAFTPYRITYGELKELVEELKSLREIDFH